MSLPAKEVTCQCGNTMTLEVRNLRCIKCGKHLFYNAQEARRHRFNIFYVVALFALAAGFITYLFMEMIVKPLFG